MKLPLRIQYALFITFIHLALIYLIFRWLGENKVLFIVSEVFVLISILVAIRIYRAFGQPSEFISSGIEAIKDKDFTIKFVPTGNSEVDELIDVYNLMIDQLRTERTKQMEQQFFLEKLIEASPIAILIQDFDDRIALVNSKAVDLLQRRPAQLQGRTLAEVNHPLLEQLTDLDTDAPQTVKISGIETYRVFKSHFIDRGFRRSFLMLEELTSEILETEKKAYSKVIRMMAHEVNNSIGAINSILDVTQTYLRDSDYVELKDALHIAMERNHRLNHFMRRFADVVRLPLPQRSLADLNELTRNVTRLMQPQAEARGLTVRYSMAAYPIEKAIDVEQMEQVLVNVLKNAIEACIPGNTVEVITNDRQLIIRDNGQPISPELEMKLFDPFFSSKPDGQGIGLTLTREILLNHGFTFSLKTNADGWTEFGIRI
ncbi:ATP-binding protein [Nibrella viscosa]|uniref:histidine kinase n=1 Tax=Nibrella viscosa TaxID=1084524 RepID=A0ABP8KTY4_9BACT